MARILVIDDDPLTLKLLTTVLQRQGFQVAGARNGRVAMELFREQPANLVITDLIMPEQEGFETIVELRCDFPDVKIIAMSAGDHLGPGDYLEIAKRLDADRAFAKPFQPAELVAAVRELLREE